MSRWAWLSPDGEMISQPVEWDSVTTEKIKEWAILPSWVEQFDNGKVFLWMEENEFSKEKK